MIISEVKIRVRYGETDQMGVVYHGNYALYLEEARTESLRQVGFTYKTMEETGVMMPVASLSIQYKRPARYDDLLTVKAYFKSMPDVRAVINYEIFNQHETLIATAETTLVFVDMKTNKVTKCPSILWDVMKPYFES